MKDSLLSPKALYKISHWSSFPFHPLNSKGYTSGRKVCESMAGLFTPHTWSPAGWAGGRLQGCGKGQACKLAHCLPCPHTASLCLSRPYFFPLLHDRFPCRTSRNHRAWHYLQTSHLPTSVYQIQGMLSGADQLTGALFSSHEGSCIRPHQAPCILLGVTCFWKEQGDWQHETQCAMGWLRWNDSHSVTAKPSLPTPGSSPTVPVGGRGGHRVEGDLDINSDWITQQPELLFRTSI